VDRDPGITPEADAAIDDGVASVTQSAALPETDSGKKPGGIPEPPSIHSDELSDVDISSEGYLGNRHAS